MTRYAIGPLMAAAIAGTIAFAPPAAAKTVKECRAEWTANKAANQAKGVTEKAYVEQCRAADDKSAAKDDKAKSTSSAKETKATPTAKDPKESKDSKAAAAGGKTAKECADEWRANKAANQAKGVTEKAYVADCRSGKTTAMTQPSSAAAAAPKSEPAPPRASRSQEAATPPPSAPAAAPSKPAATTASAPASGKPQAANQFAAENQAQSHCPRGLVVWANTDSKIYHFSGHSDYGHTKQGAYMCEQDAEAQGMRAAKNEKHP